MTIKGLDKQALLQQAGELGKLLEGLATFVTVVDRDLTILSINKHVAGLENRGVIGNNVLAFVEPAYHELISQGAEEVWTTGNTVMFESVAAGPKSSLAWYENHLGPIYHDGQVAAVLVLGIDITDRKGVEKTKKESERRIRDLFDRTPISIWNEDFTAIGQIMDDLRREGVDDLRAHFDTHPQDLIRMAGLVKIRSVNAATLSLFAADSEEQLFGALPKLFNEDSYAVFAQELIALWDGRSLFEAETQNKTLDGRTVHFLLRVLFGEDEGHPNLSDVIVTMVDITERKWVEEALGQSEARLAEAQERAHLGGWHLDVTTGQGWWSPQMYELYYRDPSLGEPNFEEYLELIHPDDVQTVLQGYEIMNETHKAESMEVRTHPANGPVRHLGLSLQIAETRGDRVVRVAGWAQDITQRKQAESQRLALEARMRDTQKLESLGVLAGGIAHDFNNLLVGILGNASLALSDLPQDTVTRSYIEDIERSATRAADLCRQMLDYSGRGHFVMQAVDLNELVSEMSGLLQATISKRVSVDIEFEGDQAVVDADATQLRQVIMNLIINASEAMEEQGGVVRVGTKLLELSPQALAETYLDDDLPAGSYVCLSVADTGPGMDKQTRSKVFEPFFTTKFTGRGLGLASVLGIVRGHKGAIRIDSQPGQGTSFRVLLPVRANAGTKTDKEQAADGPWCGSGHVLVVDDDATVIEVATRMLERLGFSVLQAADGLAAVDEFIEHADEISFVLMDLSMPKMSGVEAAEEIWRNTPDVKIIFSSGFDKHEVMNQLANRAAASFINKPYLFSELSDKIHEVCGQAATESDSE